MNIKRAIKKIPIIGPLARNLYRSFFGPSAPFRGSEDYWNNRYNAGGSSGGGSYRHLAKFKAEVLNGFVIENGIASVIEYGCGDGNQLGFANYPRYIGFDVSATAIERCRERFSDDSSKAFKLMDCYQNETADLIISLDVIYHLVEDSVFEEYMKRLFDSSDRFVIIYSSNSEDNAHKSAAHVRHREFTKWIEDNQPNWALDQFIPNKHPFNGDLKTGSFADFFVYAKTDSCTQRE